MKKIYSTIKSKWLSL